MRKSPFLITMTLFLLMSVLFAYSQETIESLLNAVENEMSQLRQNNFDLLSPENYSKANEEFSKAKKEFQEGKDIRGIKERLEKAGRYLKVVNDIGKQGEILFKDVLVAREDALLAQAPEFASPEFEAAEKSFLEASTRLEKGDLNGARSRSVKTEEAYRQSELKAIKESIIGNVRNLLDEAKSKDVKNYAPMTLNDAETLYNEVLLTLNSNRYAKSNARETANEAAYQARHAMYLATVIEKLKKDDKNWEKLIREFEITLDTIATELGFKGKI